MIYFGISIGIAVRGNDLEIVCVKARRGRPVVTGFLRIEGFLSKPPATVAEIYRRFRKQNHALTTSVTVALPRNAGLIRLIELPAEVAPNIAQAVEYQIDGLHPFEEGSVAWDWALLQIKPPAGQKAEAIAEPHLATLTVAAAMAEREALYRLVDWFQGAGIDVACLTFAVGTMYRALMRARAASAPLILLDGRDGTAEILGIGADARFHSRESGSRASFEREIDLCAAELRLAGNSYQVAATGTFEGERPAAATLEEVAPSCVPGVRSAAEDFKLSESFAAYSAALDGLELRLPGGARRRGLKWNLLPAEKRVYRSHWAYSVAAILIVIAFGLGVARLTAGWVQDRSYSAWLDAQTRALAPRVQYLEKLDSKQKNLLAKIEALETERRDVPRKLQIWLELTRVLPANVWLQSMSIMGSQVTVSGQGESASGLLQTITQSPYFEQAEFVNAVTKNSDGRDAFQIRIRVREMPVAAAAQAPAAPANASGAPPQPQSPAAAAPAASPAVTNGKGAR